MRKILGALLILSTIATPALAGSIFSRSCYHGSCYYTFTDTGSNSARVVDVPPDLNWTKAKDDEWVAFCKPVKNVDSLGITRLSYAHDGCGFGRSR